MKFNKRFVKSYEKADAKIKSSVDKKIKIFLKDPFHPLLNNHALTGKFTGYRSINITGDWRAIYSTNLDNGINFELLGTHSQLYH